MSAAWNGLFPFRLLRGLCGCLGLDGGLRGGEACDGHAVGAAGDVGQADFVAEFHGLRFAALFAADAGLQVPAGGASGLDRMADHPADAVAVDGLEGIGGDDVLAEIFADEGSDIVAGETEGHLGEVVGAEGEEFGFLGHLSGEDGGARDLDHGADHVVELFDLVLRGDFRGDPVDDLLLVLELVRIAGHGDHHFDVAALLVCYLHVLCYFRA